MFLARVTGTVVATVKDDALAQHKLLVVSPLSVRGAPPRALIATDAVGAGVGELVYCCRGKEASFPWLPASVPTDAAIVGIVDATPREPGWGSWGPRPGSRVSGTRGEAVLGPAPIKVGLT